MTINKRNVKKLVLQSLEETVFPINKTRLNICDNPTQAFALGTVNYRGQKSVGYKTQGESKYNNKFSELFSLIKKLIFLYKPNFEYTTIQVNKNILSKPHVDKNNIGSSYIIALGEFIGGELVIEGKKYKIHNRWKHFDGTKGHWVNDFKGTRYSLVFFTHTFKPPSPLLRYITVTKYGMYKKDKLISKYLKRTSSPFQ